MQTMRDPAPGARATSPRKDVPALMFSRSPSQVTPGWPARLISYEVGDITVAEKLMVTPGPAAPMRSRISEGLTLLEYPR